MVKNKHIVLKDTTEVVLHNVENLLSITDHILQHRIKSLVRKNDWIDELIIWAENNNITEKQFPRNKNLIISLVELDLSYNTITDLSPLSGLTNLEGLYIAVSGWSSATGLEIVGKCGVCRV